MLPGYALLVLALLATLASAALFLASQITLKGQSLARVARLAAVAAAVLISCSAGYLVLLIETHQFQVDYVAEFSSKESQARYLLAAFWGGQEGSILLWAFWTGILGAVLAYRAGGKEARVWPLFAILQTFLLALSLLKSPFHVTPGPAPADGQGLNPLLENQWMVIHPPILFLGFAAMAIPWAWAMYGLIYKDWDGWVKRALSWTVFAFAVQGFGIALGGYWAYETLGWGGFWGWDPVENSSLVPWLFLIGLLHGIPIQRTNGGFKASNFVFAVLPFAFMCYGTFLTRSGILANFSVHSFSSLGKDGFAMLLGVVSFSFAAPLGLLIARFRAIPKPVAYSAALTREFGLALAFIALGAAGLITSLGMSAPLISRIWLAKGAGAQPDFYNHALFPLVVVIMILLAVTPFLSWRSSETGSVGTRIVPAYLAAIALSVIVFVLGGRNPWMLLLFAASAFALTANIGYLVIRLRQRQTRFTIGAVVAHIGTAMLVAGIACLVAFSHEDKQVTLIKDQPSNALGYKLTYLGMTSQPYDRDNALRIRVEKAGHTWEATPHLYMASWQGTDQLFANPPDIHNFLWGDLYAAHNRGPFSMDQGSPNNGVVMHKGDSFTYGDYGFTYRGLTWSDAVAKAMQSAHPEDMDKLPELSLYANVDVTYRGVLYPIKPQFVIDRSTALQDSMSATIPGHATPAGLPGPPNAILAVNGINMQSDVTLTTSNLPDPYETVQIDLSTKPMIWLVWLGTILYTLGGLFAYLRRALEYGKEEEPVEAPPTPAPTGRPRVRKRNKPAAAANR